MSKFVEFKMVVEITDGAALIKAAHNFAKRLGLPSFCSDIKNEEDAIRWLLLMRQGLPGCAIEALTLQAELEP